MRHENLNKTNILNFSRMDPVVYGVDVCATGDQHLEAIQVAVVGD